MGIENKRILPCKSVIAIAMCGLLVISIASLNGGYPVRIAEAATTDPCDNSLSVRNVTASKSSANPYRAIDGSSETSWNTQGKNSWIKLDFGILQTVCYADIDWFSGSSLQYNFAISVSSDGKSWLVVYNGKSSGTQSAFDRYDFDNVNARWLKLAVSGNQHDMRSSVQEIQVHGNEVGAVSTSEPVTPVQPAPSPEPDIRYDPDTVIDSVKNGLGQSVANGGTTSNPQLNIYYHGVDNVGIAYFEGSLDAAAWSRITTASPLALTVNTEGQHSYRIRAIDDGGRLDHTPAQFTWTYNDAEPAPAPLPDLTPPSLSIESPNSEQSFPAGTASVTVSGTASDNVAIAVVEVSLDNGLMIPVTGTENWSSVIGDLANGQNYTVAAKAKDAAGNVVVSSTSFSIKSPEPTPPQSSESDEKMLKVTLNTWSNEDMQYDLFNPYLNSNTDQVRMHVSLNHAVSAAEYTLTENLPSKTKGMEFFTIAEIAAYAPILKQKGYQFCDYDIEPGEGHTPQAEFDNFVISIRTASEICHDAGLEMHCSPANWKLRQADNIEKVAPVCDELHFQFQVTQEEPERYLSFAKEYSTRARDANPNIRLTIQLSTQQPAAPGMSLLDTFKTDWTNVKPHIDGVSIWWGNGADEKATMTDFMEWFNQHGRA